MSVCSAEQRDIYFDNFRGIFFAFAAESIFFGIYVTLAIFSTVHLGSKAARTKMNRGLIGAIVIMFATALTHWIVHLLLTWFFARSMVRCTELPSSSTGMRTALDSFQIVNSTIGDLVVCWRAWILWGRPRWIPPIIALFGLSAIILSAVNLTSNHDKRLPGTADQYRTLTLVITSALINLWGTSLIAYKAWAIRNEWREFMGTGTRQRSFSTNALALITGSGVVYNIFWALFVCSEFDFFGLASPIVQMSMIQVTGIYPTLVIFLVFVEKRHSDLPFNSTSSLPWVVAS
ncbi:hypothetical protein OF83DRAFT_606131 [Amylostereum chailletii]|nr:hypothetical protein OF83DRAFT_606131 [Amylostereum chailletii]